MASDSLSTRESPSTGTQNTQYDTIGTKYTNATHTLAAAEPEEPSVVKYLGDVRGQRCLELACGTGRYTHLLHKLGAAHVYGYDISPAMVAGARTTYPKDKYPTMHFDVADCSKRLPLSEDHGFPIIFAGWFLNYAGTETELERMFAVIAQNLTVDGVCIAITTNVQDKDMHLPKRDFYGLEVEAVDLAYKEPGGDEVLGIKASVRFIGAGVQFECFQLREEVYERCAGRAVLKLSWKEAVLPEDARRESGYWNAWLERPTFSVVEVRRV